MIEYIKGEIVELTPARMILECAGIGYELNISLNTYTFYNGKPTGKIYVYEVIPVSYTHLDVYKRQFIRSENLKESVDFLILWKALMTHLLPDMLQIPFRRLWVCRSLLR